MGLFDKFLQDIGVKKSSNDNVRFVPVESGKIKRSEKFTSEYNEWLGSDQFIRFVNDIAGAYNQKKNGIQPLINFHVFNSPYSNGFYISHEDRFADINFQFMLDYLRDTIIDYGYRCYTSQYEIMEKNDFLETTEKHYLKPKDDSFEGTNVFNQLYGNIELDLVKVNDKPSYLKMMVNVYSDRNYTSPLPFEELFSKIFK